MPEFEIVQVSEDEPRQWHTKDGKAMLSYEVQFEGDQGAGFADVNKLATSQAPSVGEVYDELKPGFGDKKATLKKAWKQDAPGQKSFGGGGMSPEREKAIVRQHSQEMAIRWIDILERRGKLPDPVTHEWLRAQIDWWQQDAETTPPMVTKERTS